VGRASNNESAQGFHAQSGPVQRLQTPQLDLDSKSNIADCKRNRGKQNNEQEREEEGR